LVAQGQTRLGKRRAVGRFTVAVVETGTAVVAIADAISERSAQPIPEGQAADPRSGLADDA
jgi:hypothetical protein